MQIPLQITLRHMETSEALEARIREKVAKLEQLCDQIISCRVLVEAAHHHHHKGYTYQVRLDIGVPGKEIVVSRDHAKNHAHEDVYVALRDAFESAKRQLEGCIQKKKQQVKTHEVPPHGHVIHVAPDHGFIKTADGREVYFHRNSVLNEKFSEVEVGSEVRFNEVDGEEGPQASTVSLIGKHHIVG